MAAPKNIHELEFELNHGTKNPRNILKDVVDSFVNISGSNNIHSGSAGPSDPGVAGQLFLTGSDAFGGAAGYDVICISRG